MLALVVVVAVMGERLEGRNSDVSRAMVMAGFGTCKGVCGRKGEDAAEFALSFGEAGRD